MSREKSMPSSEESNNNNSPSPTGHWQNIIESLNGLLSTLKNNFVCIINYIITLWFRHIILQKLLFQVPRVLVQNIFTQTFSYINIQLFNRYLLYIYTYIPSPCVLCNIGYQIFWVARSSSYFIFCIFLQSSSP